MADYKVTLSKYDTNMKGIIGQITHKGGDGRRMRNAGANARHTIKLTSYLDNSVWMIINEADLYIWGFRNAHGTFRFSDKPLLDGTDLPIGCSYTAAGGIRILFDATRTVCTTERDAGSISYAIDALHGYDGTQTVDEAMKANLTMIIFMLSESFRFSLMFHKMCRVLKHGEKFTLASFKELVTNWQTLSSGAPVPGFNQSQIATYQV